MRKVMARAGAESPVRRTLSVNSISTRALLSNSTWPNMKGGHPACRRASRRWETNLRRFVGEAMRFLGIGGAAGRIHADAGAGYCTVPHLLHFAGDKALDHGFAAPGGGRGLVVHPGACPIRDRSGR